MGDYYHAGWLCVVKSISDLAAMGAIPSGVVVSVDLPPEAPVEYFDRFFEGVVECSEAHGTMLIAGNIKEAHAKDSRGEVVPQAVSCAIGYTPRGKALLRGAPKPGDRLFVVDKAEFGGFWAGIATHLKANVCSALQQDLVHQARQMALTPRAKVREAAALLANSDIAFCMDNSDGLLASALDLVKTNDVDAFLSIGTDQVSAVASRVAEACGCDSRAWALGWGACHLLCAASPENTANADSILRSLGSEMVVIGEVVAGSGTVIVNGGKVSAKTSSSLRGDQFNPDSFWQIGVKKYADDMLSLSIEDIVSGNLIR